MDPRSIFGAGLLGSLNYDESRHRWAIELGQWLETFRSAYRSCHSNPELIPSICQESISNLNYTLWHHGVYLTMSEALGSANNNPDSAVKSVQEKVLEVNGASALALVCIGQCTWALGKEYSRGEHTQSLVRYHLDNIDYLCHELNLESQALGQILHKQHRAHMDMTSVSRLLVLLSQPLRVLLVTAEPRDQGPISVEKEYRQLKDAIQSSRFGESLVLSVMSRCRTQDITSALDAYAPNILHFSGHGNQSGLCFEDDYGRAALVPKEAFSGLLCTQRNLKLVVLSACYSHDQAQAIADAVGYVISMEGSLLVSDAITFSREFYRALGHGRTFEDSFNRARSALAMTSSYMGVHFLKSAVAGQSLEDPPWRGITE